MKYKLLTPLLSIAIVSPIIAISCGKKNIDMPSQLSEGWEKQTNYQIKKYEDSAFNMQNLLESKKSGFGSNIILSKNAYNALYDKLGKYDVAIAIIADHKLYEQILPVIEGNKVWDILDRSGFEFKYSESLNLGKFLNTFKVKGDLSWKSGTRTEKNYNDFYPLYYINHNFSQFGVSNWNVSPREVYEISYDDK